MKFETKSFKVKSFLFFPILNFSRFSNFSDFSDFFPTFLILTTTQITMNSLDPTILFDYNGRDPYYFEQNTLIFGIFYINPVKSNDAILSRLNDLYLDLIHNLEPYINYYPWYYKPIEVKFFRDFRGIPVIYGELIYGDYMPDLWLLTKILFEFSSTDTDLYIRLIDQDGEFPLIEGYEAIPAWLNDDNSASNRVWINNHVFKIIPKSYSENTELKLVDAIHYISMSPFRLESCIDLTEKLQNEILKQYPGRVLEKLFLEHMSVPRSVFEFIARNSNYVCNAAINSQVGAIGSSSGNGKLVKSGARVEIEIRVSLLAHLFLKKYAEDSSDRGELVVKCLERFLSDEVSDELNIKWDSREESVEDFNRSTEEDRLQEELKRFGKINRSYESKEEKIEDNEAESNTELIDKLKTMLESDVKEGGDGDDGDSNDSDSNDNEVHNNNSNDDDNDNDIIADFQKQGVDIDEDDFFEFFCKEALKLKDGDLEKMRNGQKGDEKDINALASLLASLHTEGEDSG